MIDQAFAFWDDLADYKGSSITVYEVKQTFPSIFFLQEIEDSVVTVTINCVQKTTEKLKKTNNEHRLAIQAVNKAMTKPVLE